MTTNSIAEALNRGVVKARSQKNTINVFNDVCGRDQRMFNWLSTAVDKVLLPPKEAVAAAELVKKVKYSRRRKNKMAGMSQCK